MVVLLILCLEEPATGQSSWAQNGRNSRPTETEFLKRAVSRKYSKIWCWPVQKYRLKKKTTRMNSNHLQEASPSGRSFTRGQPILMTICKRLVHPDEYLQGAGSSGRSFARGQSIRIIICKRPIHLVDHLPVHPDDHLQEAGPSGWSMLLLLFLFCSGEKEKPRRKWRKTFGEEKLMVTPTNRQGEYSAICLFEGWKID